MSIVVQPDERTTEPLYTTEDANEIAFKKAMLSPGEPADTDEEMLARDDYHQMLQHNEQYSNLLEAYVQNTTAMLHRKRGYKHIFFWCSLGVMGLACLGLLGAIVLATARPGANVLALVSAPLLSFLTTFLVLPKIITQYLFNPEEEKNMCEVVKNIQEFDLNLRKNQPPKP